MQAVLRRISHASLTNFTCVAKLYKRVAYICQPGRDCIYRVLARPES